MGEFTPGPWFVREPDSPLHVLISANGDDTGGGKNGGVYIGRATGPDAVSNAHLIAAAPDLYSQGISATQVMMAVAQALRKLGQESLAVDLEACTCTLDEALAKARGEVA